MLTIDELEPGNIVDYHRCPALICEKRNDAVVLGGLGQFNIDPGPTTLLANIGPFFPEDSDFEHMGFERIEYVNGDYSYRHKLTGYTVDIVVEGELVLKPLHEIQNEIFNKYGKQLPTQEIFRRRPAI